LVQKEKKEKQPLLYDLTELQKEANRKYKYSADETLKIMQSLYETHKILTYPRTSSRYISKNEEKQLPELINKLASLPDYEKIVADIKNNNRTIAKRMVDDSKVTDHYAIIPTDKKPMLSQLNREQLNIYNMVIKRFLAAFMPECVKDHTELVCNISEETFKATGTIITTPGWRQLYNEEDSALNTKKKDKETLLPIVKKDDPIDIQKIALKEGQTKAPPLHNEATILAAMETAGKIIEDEELRQAMKNCGLGTPATRAQILEKLIHVQYITRENNKLTPTQKGEYIIDNIVDEDLLSPELTGQWEKKLNDIADSKFVRETYMNEIKDFIKVIVDNVNNSNTYALRADQKVFGDCPTCKEGKIIETQKAFGCTNWKSKGCKFVIWKMIAGKVLTEKQAETLLKKGQTPVIKGFKNKAGNPFNAALKLENGEIRFDFQQESLGTCPKCEGDIVETPKAYSCNNWRTTGCKFVIWKEFSKRKIKKAEAIALLKNGKTETLEGFKNYNGNPMTGILELVENQVSLVPD